MNNEQFRKLMLANSAKSSKDGPASSTTGPAGGSSLGSRQRSSIPMTPRSVGGGQTDFARQLAERNKANQTQKKFRSFVPRGVRLGSGYIDRTKEREAEAKDDREERLKALEESLKNEEIDQETFDKLRFEIAGGDLSSTHLVKGLDFKLLEKIRRGEDPYSEKQAEPEEEVEQGADVDDEFDQLEEREVQAVAKDKTEKKKKGQLSTVSLAPGRKRTRDQLLAELKASRAAKQAQQESALGGHFKKIGAKQMPGSRIERDSKGREVLIIIDEDGHEKRKVRKLQRGVESEKAEDKGLLMPDKNAKPLGMEVPEQFRKREEPEEEEEDFDIFEGVGDDYDPLAGMGDSDSGSDEDEESDNKRDKGDASRDAKEGEVTDTTMPPPPKPTAPSAPRNYFKDSKTGPIEELKAPSMSDPAIMAAIKRAAALNPIGRGEDDDEDDEDQDKAKAMEERRKKLLRMADRDDEDLDLGFGTSRFEDEEDMDESRVKLSNWNDRDGAEEGRSGGAGSKRKRGPKKRKGDVNSAADVLRVMEQRKKS